MPLVWELTSEIKNWLTPEKLRDFSAGWRAQGTGPSKAVIEDFVSILARPEMHYEALLGYLETQFMRFNNTLRQEYHGFYSWLIEMVYYILYYRQINNRAFLDKHLPRFDGIRALTDVSTPLWVFSLNHDVVVETIAARLSIPLHTGFSTKIIRLPRRNSMGQKIGEIHAETLTQDQLDNKAMFYPNPLQSGIYLMKIHGALDIFTFNDGKDLLKLLPEGSDTYGYIEALRAANEDLVHPLPGAPNGKAKATNEIAYADEAGEMQFLRRSLLSGAYKFSVRSQQVLPKSMLKHFQTNLNFVTNLICIGYGFGDLHINAIIREWLEFTPDRRLEIVNPSIEGVPSFLLQLSPQVTLTKNDTSDFLDQRSGTVRTWREQLEKRIAASLRRRGQPRAAQDMNAFVRKSLEESTALLAKKLSELPHVDGQPNLAALGDPNEVANRWAAEAKMDEEEFLKALLDHLERTENG
ncbi:hypothetical protein [Rhizobium aouanii]